MEDLDFHAVDDQMLHAIRLLGRNRAGEGIVLEHVDNVLQVHKGIVANLHLRQVTR